ncbi:ankyrin repeat domain-containing protein [Chroococcidiopsis thermalis]|jgi:ankyrin repeat protein|uniref:Uncharacterized protein n=1 Tax=Chroococcidiopsis thermalis (strain PCC 7203) TaxID=251229 RepID=K9U2Z4_CHRTP|nr:ankyrin repeat domain-containing protein [Chroococcidiopsis thermalis]AFY89462.1 hypothetical protein Chro_4058 [Chroococcidiopsis thermalis PCC 7203]PSB47570.1 ankyrin repeat domain-containing protein [Cyanosarcina cf. burmensis CCALA 770]
MEDVDSCTNYCRLHFAAKDGDENLVKQQIEEGCPVNDFDELGKTPLHHASQKGHIAVIKLLLEAGADVNAHDESKIGDTPLGEVAGNCDFEVAKLLIDAGANPTIPGWMQLTALHRAKTRKKPEGKAVYQLLLDVARKKFNYRER